MSRKSAEFPSDYSPSTKLQKEHVHNETHLENDKIPSSSYFTSDISILKFPVEVMTHVFRFMSLRERLNASLVCKEWNEAASHPSYSHAEKLVFRGYQDCEKLLKFLLKTERKILHLEFHSCDLSGSNLFLIADKIHYLGFHYCRLSSTLQIELFTKCVNLKEFYIKCSKMDGNPLPCFNREIVNLLEQKHFINYNLKALSLDSLQTDLTAHNILSIFKMFPNIRHLSFRPTEMYWNSDNLSSNKSSIAILIQEIVSLKHTLEDFKTMALEPQLRSLVLHDFTRLRRISLPIQKHIPEALIFDLFSRLKCLERISCSSDLGSSFHTRFFEHLINQCSNLKHLKLKCHRSSRIDLNPEMFRALLSSKLTSLKIIAANIRPTSDELFTTSTNFPANKTLRVLRISTLINHRMQCLFIQSFTNLRVLHLECFSGTVLESIGQFQKNLTTLNLNMVSRRFPNIHELISSASIWRLDQVYNCLQSLACLENLYLNFFNFPYSILFNCKFIPSSVKYLHITFSDLDSTFDSEADKHLILALKEKTELEGIYFAAEDDRKTDLSIWSEICSSLNKLRFLSLRGRTTPLLGPHNREPEFFEKTPEELFECCPSLRFFTRTSDNYHGLLHYDYVGRKMKNVKYQSKMFDYLTVDKVFDSKIKFSLMGDAILLPYY